jgi:AraC-like DNA-binding protein
VVYVERGNLRGRFCGEQLDLPEGCVFWLPPGTTRQLWSLEEHRTLYDWRLMFSVSDGNETLGLDEAVQIRADGDALAPHFQLLHETADATECNSSETPLLLAALIWRFSSLPNWRTRPPHGLNAAQRRRVDRLVQQGLLDRVQPADLAACVGLSLDYFTRLFRRTYGMPPRRYLLVEGMRLAAQILTDSAMSVKELCAFLGEADKGTFCRQFKTVMGCTPTAYRRREHPTP